MKLPGSAREIQSSMGRAKGKVKRVESQAKRAQSKTKKVSGGKSGSKSAPTPKEAPEPQSVSHAEPAAVPEPVTEAGSTVAPEPVAEAVPTVAPESVPAESKPMSSSLQYAIVGVLGAIGAVLLGLAVADTGDDRMLFPLIGVPLGALLAVGVVASLHWAELLDHSD